MSDDELCLMMVAVGFGLTFWVVYYVQFAARPRLRPAPPTQAALLLTPVVCLGALLGMLTTAASFDVVSNGLYVALYFCYGAAWIGGMVQITEYLGVGMRADAVERGNSAAGYAVTGALLGFTACYAGGNIGDGPGWWAVTFAAGLATTGFVALWALTEAATHMSEAVTIERDPAAGVRMGGFLLALGLILGRAAAGDFYNFDQQFNDFARQGVLAVGVVLAALVLERLLRPTPERPSAPALAGVPAALVYLAIAGAALVWLGPVK